MAVFVLAAARAITEGSTGKSKIVAFLCVLKFFAALAAIAAELPFTHKSIFPTIHLYGYVPCLDASPWVAESMALGLVILTTCVNIFMARATDDAKYKMMTLG